MLAHSNVVRFPLEKYEQHIPKVVPLPSRAWQSPFSQSFTCVCDCLFVEKNLERMPEKLFRSGFVMDMGVFCALCVGVCRGGNYYIQ